MKIGKDELKALIKECLLEILSEGLGSQLTERAPPRARNRDAEPLPGSKRVTPAQAANGRYRPDLDTPVTRQRQAPPAAVPTEFAKDPMMAAIFSDTAARTLQLQESAPALVQGDMATRAAASMDPSELFGDRNLDVWNKAAFAPSRPGIIPFDVPPFDPDSQK